jgi:hypothetical protein
VSEQPARRNIDQYVGYAEKIQLREKPETTTPKVNASVLNEALLKNIKPLEKQAGLSDKLLMEMSKELKYLRTAMDTKLSHLSWTHNSQTFPIRTDLLQRLAGMSISKKLSVMIANRFTDHSNPELVFAKAREMLVKALPIAADNLLETGGIVALVGPTGVGKTEIARRLSRLASAPFVKVEASKFTEVGYVGRDVESMIRDLTEISIGMVKSDHVEKVQERAKSLAEERLLDLLLPPPRAGRGTGTEEEEREKHKETRERLRMQLREGKLDNRYVDIEVKEKMMPFGVVSNVGLEDLEINLKEMLGNFLPEKSKRKNHFQR